MKESHYFDWQRRERDSWQSLTHGWCLRVLFDGARYQSEEVSCFATAIAIRPSFEIGYIKILGYSEQVLRNSK
jgi:hypothetical protein